MKNNFILPLALLLTSCSYFYSSPVSVSNQDNQTSTIAMEREPVFQLTEAYEVAATRITNKMLNDTVEIYTKQPQPKIYIKDIVKDETTSDARLGTAQRAMRTLIKGTNSYIISETENDTDFILESSVHNLNTGEQPTIQFKLNLNNKDSVPVQAWSIVIKQMPEDQSWW